MAEKIVSPGVFTRENDLSFIQEGVGAIGAAVVGPFKQGPAFIPTTIESQTEFEQTFGRVDGTYYTQQTVQNYLREAGTITVVRVGGIGGYEQSGSYGIFTSGSTGRSLIANFHSTRDGIVDGDHEDLGFTDVTLTQIENSTKFTLSGSLGDVTGSLDRRDSNDIQSIYGLSPLGTKNGYLYSFLFDDVDIENLESGSVEIEGDVLPEQYFNYPITNAWTPWVVSHDKQIDETTGSNPDNIDVDRLFRFRTKGSGTAANTQFKVSLTNIQGEDGDFASFTVLIRDYSDSDNRPVVLESYSNVNLDPTSPNYIARVIGNMYQEYNSVTNRLDEHGEYPSRSQYVTVEVADENSYSNDAVPYGHEGYYNTVNLDDPTELPPVTFSIESFNNDAGNTRGYSGIAFTAGSSRTYLNPLPSDVNGEIIYETGSNDVFLLSDPIEIGGDIINEDLFDEFENDADVVAKRQFTLGFQGGFDGKSPAIDIAQGEDITDTNSQGFDIGAGGDDVESYINVANILSNQDQYDFNLIVTPGVIKRLHLNVYQAYEDLVENRQDVFYVADFVLPNDSIQDVTTESNLVDSSYVGTYYPWVRVVDSATNQQKVIPPSVLMPAVYAANDRLSAEWYAPAGLNRGGIQGAVGISRQINQNDRDVLYENKVNPISSFPNQGIVAWGQKTLQERPSALDRINVRRLLIRVKKFIASTSRFLVFEQNTATTRNRFINTVNPYFESIQQRQGLYAFRVVMDESNNTPDVVDRNILKGSIFLQPTRTAEFIVIDFNVLPTGATFDV